MANLYVRNAGSGTAPYDTWAKAATTLTTALGAAAAGDDIWVASDHTETTAGAVTLTSPGTITSPCRVICVSAAGSTPPVAADISTMTNSIATSGANALNIAGVASGTTYFEGITFSAGSSTSNAGLNIGSSTGTTFCNFYFKNCKFVLGNTNTSSGIVIGANGNGVYNFVMDNCTVKFGATAQSVYLQNGRTRWINTASIIDATGSIPTTLFNTASGTLKTSLFQADGVGFQAKTSGNIVGAANAPMSLIFNNCRTDSGVTAFSAAQTAPGVEVIVSRTTSSAINYPLSVFRANGNTDTVTNPIRNGGAAGPDATVIAWRVTTSSAAKQLVPFRLQELAQWNDSTSSVTATVYGIYDAAAVPTNAEVWAEFYYLSSASYPVATLVSTAPATILTSASNLTTDTSDWDDGATARANTTAYSAGDIIKVAGNAGRVFFCTSGGTSNGSEPAGYATAVDGDSVTDSGATFRAGCRFKIASTFTPAMAGPIFVRLFVAKASVVRLYIDPRIVLS